MGKANGAKVPSSSSGSALVRIAKLEQTLLSTPYDPNLLLPLIALARQAAPDTVHKAIWALHRVFIRYIAEGKVGGIISSSASSRHRPSESAEVEVGKNGEVMEAREVRGWVRDRLLDYIEILSGLMRDSEAALRVSLSTKCGLARCS